jgi:hypothetical protein
MTSDLEQYHCFCEVGTTPRPFSPFLQLSCLFVFFNRAIVMFLSVLRHLKIQKPTSQQGRKTRENNKIHSNVLELCLIIKISLINDKGLELTNQFCISY